jgi:hypothetical protein
MSLVKRFKHGGVEYPITSETDNTLLEDADPALFYAGQFFENVLNTYVGPRLLTQAALSGLNFPSAVQKRIHVPPEPFLFSGQLQFPIFCLHRSEDEWSNANKAFNYDASVWEWAYLLPPLLPGQIERLYHIYRSVAVVISTFAMQSFDPDFEEGATLRDLSGIRKMVAGPVKYGGFEQVNDQDSRWWRAVSGKLIVEEQDSNAEDVFQQFKGVNVDVDLAAPNVEPFEGFVEVSTPEDLTIETVSPSTGTRQGSTLVTIDGTGFRPGAGTYQVLFGGAYATNVVVVHPTRILCITPPRTDSPTFAADVQVIGPAGEESNVLERAFTFTTP